MMLKNPSLGFFNGGTGKCDFPVPRIFNGLRPLKMTAHPCAAHRLVIKRVYRQPVTEAGGHGQTPARLLVALFLPFACATAVASEPAGGQGSLEEVLQRAQAALEPCRALQCLWRDSEALLQQARDAAAAGERERALRLARRAARQGELAENQYWLERAKRCLERRGIDWKGTGTGPAVRAVREYRGAQAYRFACGDEEGEGPSPVSP